MVFVAFMLSTILKVTNLKTVKREYFYKKDI